MNDFTNPTDLATVQRQLERARAKSDDYLIAGAEVGRVLSPDEQAIYRLNLAQLAVGMAQAEALALIAQQLVEQNQANALDRYP